MGVRLAFKCLCHYTCISKSLAINHIEISPSLYCFGTAFRYLPRSSGTSSDGEPFFEITKIVFFLRAAGLFYATYGWTCWEEIQDSINNSWVNPLIDKAPLMSPYVRSTQAREDWQPLYPNPRRVEFLRPQVGFKAYKTQQIPTFRGQRSGGQYFRAFGCGTRSLRIFFLTRSLWNASIKSHRRPVAACRTIYQAGSQRCNQEWKSNLWHCRFMHSSQAPRPPVIENGGKSLFNAALIDGLSSCSVWNHLFKKNPERIGPVGWGRGLCKHARTALTETKSPKLEGNNEGGMAALSSVLLSAFLPAWLEIKVEEEQGGKRQDADGGLTMRAFRPPLLLSFIMFLSISSLFSFSQGSVVKPDREDRMEPVAGGFSRAEKQNRT